jgi:tetratricopeptide (TPR) repeat protein
MATNKKVSSTSSANAETNSVSTHEDRYRKAVEEFAAAFELLHKGDYEQALARFREIEAANSDEPSLIDRSRTYARICERRLAPRPADPQTLEELYFQAVLSSNEGKYDEALALFEKALKEHPDSSKVLYARASTWALKGNSEAAVGDLRRAIAADPQVRFQAANDPDFEPIREEPAFIDIIEPTPAGG